MTDIDDGTLNGLAAKLDGLDLTETERALLDEIMDRAEAYEPDVEGFAFGGSYSYSGFKSGADLSTTALKLGGSLGFVTRPSLGHRDPNGPIRDPQGGPGKPPPP